MSRSRKGGGRLDRNMNSASLGVIIEPSEEDKHEAALRMASVALTRTTRAGGKWNKQRRDLYLQLVLMVLGAVDEESTTQEYRQWEADNVAHADPHRDRSTGQWVQGNGYRFVTDDEYERIMDSQ